VARAERVHDVISHEVRDHDGSLAVPQQGDALAHGISGRIDVINESDEFLDAVLDRRTHREVSGGIISHRLPKEWTAVSGGHTRQTVRDRSRLGRGLVPHIGAGSADGHNHVLGHLSSLTVESDLFVDAILRRWEAVDHRLTRHVFTA
jgi:hypothetical protein